MQKSPLQHRVEDRDCKCTSDITTFPCFVATSSCQMRPLLMDGACGIMVTKPQLILPIAFLPPKTSSLDRVNGNVCLNGGTRCERSAKVFKTTHLRDVVQVIPDYPSSDRQTLKKFSSASLTKDSMLLNSCRRAGNEQGPRNGMWKPRRRRSEGQESGQEWNNLGV